MDITLALIADAANVSADGKLNIMGVFNALGASTFPVVHPQIAMVLRFEANRAEEGKTRKIEIALADGDGAKLFAIGADLVVPQAPPGTPIRLNHILMLNNLQFPRAGDYVFNVLIGDDHKAAIDLRLIEVKPEPRPTPA